VRNPRVLVVEDDLHVSRTWTRILSPKCDVALAHTLEESLAHINTHPVDVVLLDLHLPDGSGEDFLRALEGRVPRPAVAVISGYVDSERIVGLMGRCDVTVPKPIERKTLLGLVTTLFERSSPSFSVDDYCTEHGFSQREREVVRGAAEGLVNKQIADRLGLRPGTIATYWRRIYKKTSLPSQRDVLAALIAHSPTPRD